MSELDVGEKIKSFRKRAGMTQLELELEIGTAQGTISRIESGKVNPTKETINSIAVALGLSESEKLYLFSLDFNKVLELLTIIPDQVARDKFEVVFQKALNSIAERLNYVAIAVILLEGDYLYPFAASTTNYVKKAIKIIGPLDSFRIKVKDNKENLFYKSIENQKVMEVRSVRDVGTGFIPNRLADMITKFSKTRKGYVLPMVVGDRVIGSVYFAKYDTDEYRYELSFLEIVVQKLAYSIINHKRVSSD